MCVLADGLSGRKLRQARKLQGGVPFAFVFDALLPDRCYEVSKYVYVWLRAFACPRRATWPGRQVAHLLG